MGPERKVGGAGCGGSALNREFFSGLVYNIIRRCEISAQCVDWYIVNRRKNMAKSIASEVFASALSDAQRNVERARNSVLTLKAQRKPLGRLLRTLSMCVDTNNRDTTLSMWMYGDEPHITVSMYNLEGFKSLRLESVLWLLEEIGTLEEQKEYPSCLNRDYKYVANGFKVRVCAYVKDDSPTCRKVVVGTDTVTTPKYAIQCD